MEEGFFFTVFYQPIYNLLVWIISLIPTHDVGIAVILTTILVKFVLYPLTKKAYLTQIKMKELDPKIKEAREKHKGHREAEARALMEIYKEAKLNPFAGFVAIFIQLPVIFALFFIFSKQAFPEINESILYGFFVLPAITPSMLFLGLVNIGVKSWPLAILSGATQFLQAHLATPTLPPKSDKPDFSQDFARSMQVQVKYILPVIIIFVAHSLSAAVALYFVVSNIFSIVQEYILRKKYSQKAVSNN